MAEQSQLHPGNPLRLPRFVGKADCGSKVLTGNDDIAFSLIYQTKIEAALERTATPDAVVVSRATSSGPVANWPMKARAWVRTMRVRDSNACAFADPNSDTRISSENFRRK